jgi:hypothetical protein
LAAAELIALAIACSPVSPLPVTTTSAELERRQVAHLELDARLDEAHSLVDALATSSDATEQRTLMGKILVLLSVEVAEHETATRDALEALPPSIGHALLRDHDVLRRRTDELSSLASEALPDVRKFTTVAHETIDLARAHAVAEDRALSTASRPERRVPLDRIDGPVR